MKTALSIAGSDSSAGAGIQADIKAMTMNGVYATYFDGAFPARSAVAVKALPKDALVEIECIAVR